MERHTYRQVDDILQVIPVNEDREEYIAKHLVNWHADDWFSNCCIKSVDHCLSGIFVVERYLFLSQIEVLEFYWSESKWSWMSLS